MSRRDGSLFCRSSSLVVWLHQGARCFSIGHRRTQHETIRHPINGQWFDVVSTDRTRQPRQFLRTGSRRPPHSTRRWRDTVGNLLPRERQQIPPRRHSTLRRLRKVMASHLKDHPPRQQHRRTGNCRTKGRPADVGDASGRSSILFR